ncbi:PREDICTED: uncharacterized protein LOC102858437 [Elephantulus edwardii]|nr:PREDICTED: uncharacterized protein LOC102858437 [Elephantulus edwardii]
MWGPAACPDVGDVRPPSSRAGQPAPVGASASRCRRSRCLCLCRHRRCLCRHRSRHCHCQVLRPPPPPCESAGRRPRRASPRRPAALGNGQRGVPGALLAPPTPPAPRSLIRARDCARAPREPAPWTGPRGRWPREGADRVSARPAVPCHRGRQSWKEKEGMDGWTGGWAEPGLRVQRPGPSLNPPLPLRSATGATAPPAAPAGEGGPPAPPPNLTSNRRLQQTQAQVDEVVDIMRVNVDKVLERDQKLSELDDRADALQAGASQFETSAAKLKRKYWWKNLKMMIILGVICAIILIIIIVYFST